MGIEQNKADNTFRIEEYFDLESLTMEQIKSIYVDYQHMINTNE